MRSKLERPDFIPPHTWKAIMTARRIIKYAVLTVLTVVVCLLIWGYYRAKDAPRQLVVGTWYPQMTFIPRSGSSVWELLPNGQVVEHNYIDSNNGLGTIVKPERISDTVTTWSIDRKLNITFGPGVSAKGFRIVRMSDVDMVVVNIEDHSQNPFEQRLGRQCAWKTQ